MNFVEHSNLEGLHAPFSASQSSWLRYDDEKAISVFRKKKAKEKEISAGLAKIASKIK